MFFITVEGLSGAVRQADKKCLLEGLKIGKNEVNINLLQYADDTMFLCNNNVQNIVTFKSILRCFEVTYGLRVNLKKSFIGGIGVDLLNIQRYMAMLNCNIMKNLFTYLGVPIRGKQNKVLFWNGMLEKVRRKLSR